MLDQLSIAGAFNTAAWIINQVIFPVLVTAGVTVGTVLLQWIVQQARAFRL